MHWQRCRSIVVCVSSPRTVFVVFEEGGEEGKVLVQSWQKEFARDARALIHSPTGKTAGSGRCHCRVCGPTTGTKGKPYLRREICNTMMVRSCP